MDGTVKDTAAVEAAAAAERERLESIFKAQPKSTKKRFEVRTPSPRRFAAFHGRFALVCGCGSGRAVCYCNRTSH